MAEIERPSLSEAALREFLIDGSTKALGGKDAHFLGDQIAIHRRDAEPNWDATLRIAGNMWVKKAFEVALSDAQAKYNLNPLHSFDAEAAWLRDR